MQSIGGREAFSGLTLSSPRLECRRPPCHRGHAFVLLSADRFRDATGRGWRAGQSAHLLRPVGPTKPLSYSYPSPSPRAPARGVGAPRRAPLQCVGRGCRWTPCLRAARVSAAAVGSPAGMSLGSEPGGRWGLGAGWGPAGPRLALRGRPSLSNERTCESPSPPVAQCGEGATTVFPVSPCLSPPACHREGGEPGGLGSQPIRLRPQIRRDDPLNLSILLSGGKETNQDSISNGE